MIPQGATMIKAITAALLVSLSMTTFSQTSSSALCFVVSDFEGYSARGAENFEIDSDAFSGQTFMVDFSPDDIGVTPSNLSCTEAGLFTLVCKDVRGGGKLSLETWVVYPDLGKALYTKTISGYGAYDGGNLFVGKIQGRCSG